MAKKISLTGVKPTGMPHLGNYLGAIRPAIEMAKTGEYEGYYFIADYHTLTVVHDRKVMNDYIYEVAATWLALGLDPENITLYQQSHIPEILELNWILSCFTAKGIMNRAHAYKAKVQDNQDNERDPDQGVNMGIYTYPILMAADILILNADSVPVGADQVQHIEITRDIAMAFNHHYGEIFNLPKAHVQENVGTIPGLDGRKMSKSYDNHIPLFLPTKKLQKMINKIKTDSSDPTTPKNPEESLIFELFCHFASANQVKELRDWYAKGIGWGEAKAELFKVIDAEIAPAREKYEELLANRSQIDEILAEGNAKVKPKAEALLKELRKAVGVRG